MTIISQNREVAINYDNITAVELRGDYIQAYPANGGQPIPIGKYAAERAREVYAEMISTAYPQDRFTMDNPENFTAMKQYRYGVVVNGRDLTRYAPNTYYMPEE